jgi:hypothetical protein
MTINVIKYKMDIKSSILVHIFLSLLISLFDSEFTQAQTATHDLNYHELQSRI